MNLTRTIFSSALLWSALALGAEKGAPERIVRPEGYLQVEPDDGGSSTPGSFSVSPARNGREDPEEDKAKAKASPDDKGDAPSSEAEPEPQAVPPRKKTPRELCQPLADRFVARLAELRGPDAGEPLDPAVQRAMFGRVVLKALSTDPEEVVPETSWDPELKELRRTYLKCLKAERRR